ncbi:DNA-binding IclR family transcriptional regulator [Bacillus ectoiniformans]|uniref:IclR family transcriptional regulator n=1 Tax=Bacillus ectoiniformans TaxID=1494429 RepID=UPI00195910C6|nr:IclR family transcriptional regulator [Bacillus ectoiniformans]MBM7647351.1 DNA-binding IclR family transcriptional regulator [Bacillus ectoiniformans]
MSNKTVLKSMEIIKLFFQHEELTLQQIVKQTNLPKTSAHRMAESLEEMGFLQKTNEGGYKLGLMFLQLGTLVADRLDIRQLAYPVMKQLKEETGEAANLVIRDGDEAVYIEKVDTSERVRVYTQIGRRAPLYGGACPRILLAFMPENERERFIDAADIQAYASGTVTDKTRLREILQFSREHGYSISHSELEDYSSAIAAPIMNHKGEVIAGLSLVGPEIRFQDEQHLQVLIKKIKNAAKEISILSGWKEGAE